MLDKLLIVIAFLIVFGLGLLWFIFDKLCTAESRLDEISVLLYGKRNRESKESAAESALAEEGEPGIAEITIKGTDQNDEPVEESLYLDKNGKYSYKVYDENKKRREKERNPGEFIDDFEEAAEELEKEARVNPYAR